MIESLVLLALIGLLALVAVPVLLVKVGVLAPPVPATETHKPLRPVDLSPPPKVKLPSFGDLRPPEVMEMENGSSAGQAKGME